MHSRRFMQPLFMTISLAAILVGTASQVSASGFALIEQNVSGLGHAYAGQAAAAEDASTIFFNPAGLARLPGKQAVGGLHLIKPTIEYTNTRSTAATLQSNATAGEGGDAGAFKAVPNLYGSWELLPAKLWLGLGLNAPFGLATEWDANWIGRFHAIKSDVLTLNINPALAWQVHPMVALGVGLNYQRIDAELTSAVNYSALARGALGPNLEGVSKITADDWSWGWNVGVMVTLAPQTRLGIAYRSTVTHTLTGDATFSNRPAALNAALPDGPIEAAIKLPDMLSVALSHYFGPRLQVLVDYTWTGWDSIRDLSIFRANGAPLAHTPLRFKDSWRIGLGAAYHLTEAWKLRAGVAYDKTPVRDEFRTPRLPDEDRTWLAVGAQWAFTRQGAVDLGLAYLFVKDASNNLPDIDPATPAGFPATPRGTLVGHYETDVWILSAQLRYAF